MMALNSVAPVSEHIRRRMPRGGRGYRLMREMPEPKTFCGGAPTTRDWTPQYAGALIRRGNWTGCADCADVFARVAHLG